MRQSIALAAALTVLWFIGSTWYYDCKIKRVCGPEALAATAVTIAPPPLAVTETEPIALGSEPIPEATEPVAVTVEKPATATPTVAFTAHFGRKSTDIVIPPESEALLPELVEAVQQGRHLRIVGHSDARGSPALKAELSAQRATILRDWLVARGVPAAAIVAVESREDREPIADNATAEGRAENRRAVATLEP